jgi:uncharacterized membrane protein YoaK (UPF0700 family)
MNKRNIISLISALLLTFAGGFTDAYTFIYRGGVFATMQTGNLIKFFINLTNGEFKLAFLLPIVFFIIGCVIAGLLRKSKYQAHIALISLIVAYIGAGLCPQTEVWDIVCVSLLSIVGAMQFEAFRVCLGYRYTSTMCTNNIRLLSVNIAEGKGKVIAIYASIIASFIIGIVIGVLVGKGMEMYSIIPLTGIYLAVLLMFIISIEIPSNEIIKNAE